jgi:O-antigen/teichoic acid export membrane protein
MILHQLKTIPRWLHEKGFFHLLSANFLTQFLGFGTSLLVAKFLTPVELGEVKILQSYTNLFVLLAGFGLNSAVLKFCAENRPAQNKEFILRFSLLRASATTFITLLLLSLLSLTGVVTASKYLALWLLVYGLVIPFSAATQIFMVYLQALKKIKEMAQSQTLIKAQSFLVIVLCTWVWGFRGFVFATIAAYFAGLIPLLRQVGLRFLRATSGSVPIGFAGLALFSLLANGVNALGQYGDIFILDHFNQDRAGIGYYSLALTFVLAATQVTATVQSIVTPYFSERAQNETWMRRQIRRNQLRMSALSLAVAASVYGLAWVLVQTVYGLSYRDTLTYLAVLLLKYVIYSSYAVIGVAIFSLGFVRYNFIAVAISTPLGLLLSYELLQRIGIIGVAWAQVGTALLTLVLVVIAGQLALRRFFAPPAG